jgi:hypothetical protein
MIPAVSFCKLTGMKHIHAHHLTVGKRHFVKFCTKIHLASMSSSHRAIYMTLVITWTHCYNLTCGDWENMGFYHNCKSAREMCDNHLPDKCVSFQETLVLQYLRFVSHGHPSRYRCFILLPAANYVLHPNFFSLSAIPYKRLF